MLLAVSFFNDAILSPQPTATVSSPGVKVIDDDGTRPPADPQSRSVRRVDFV